MEWLWASLSGKPEEVESPEWHGEVLAARKAKIDSARRSFSVCSSKSASTVKRVIVLADAAEDIEAARDFYESQEPGGGEYCVDSLLAESKASVFSVGFIRGISNSIECGESFPIWYLLPGTVMNEIFAVLDLRRNPNWIRKELKSATISTNPWHTKALTTAARGDSLIPL